MWIQINAGPNPIGGWYCQCKTGARVVGCCAHIASVLWYLGYVGHNAMCNYRPSQDYENYVMDASSWLTDEEATSDNLS